MENEKLKKRILSFVWRLGVYAIVSVIAFVTQNISELGVNPAVVSIIALIGGEVTKWLNAEYKLKK